MSRYITTSWDDGHPSDERLSDLLGKYDLKGTFYIPRTNPGHPVMNEKEIMHLARNFEIGGHTLQHISLKKASHQQAEREIQGSYDWLRPLLGQDPVSFCPPFGEFSEDSLSLIRKAGFRVIRTTELLSTRYEGSVLPTTLQMVGHSRFTYLKHLLKRGRFINLSRWGRARFTDDPFRLLDHYLEEIQLNGGCLHLWGHSWEIDQEQGWGKLESLLKKISHLPEFTYVENRQLEKAIL